MRYLYYFRAAKQAKCHKKEFSLILDKNIDKIEYSITSPTKEEEETNYIKMIPKQKWGWFHNSFRPDIMIDLSQLEDADLIGFSFSLKKAVIVFSWVTSVVFLAFGMALFFTDYQGWEKVMPFCAAVISLMVPLVGLRLTARRIMMDILYWIDLWNELKK